MNEWVHPAGTTADGGFDTSILPGPPGGSAGLSHTGLQVVSLDAGESRTVGAGELEYIVVPLAGSATVEVDGASYELAGRRDVFGSATDVLYVPRDTPFTLTSVGGGRYALLLGHGPRLLPRHPPGG